MTTNGKCDTSNITIACIKSQYGSGQSTTKPYNGTADVVVLGFDAEYVSQEVLSMFMLAERPDQSSYQVQIETAGGAQNKQSDPGMEAMLDVEKVLCDRCTIAFDLLEYNQL